MPKTTLKQKMILVFLGIGLTAVLLEIGLRLGGSAYSCLQEKTNKISLIDKEYRILCIGESTTGLGRINSYPSQLEHILNAVFSDRQFKVINKGVTSKTSRDILARVEGYLNQYQPHLVIGMMGINDILLLPHQGGSSLSQPSWAEHFRIYKLISLIKAHVTESLKKASRTVLNNEPQREEELKSQEEAEIDELIIAISNFKILKERRDRLDQALNAAAASAKQERISKRISEINKNQAWQLVRMAIAYRENDDLAKAQAALMKAIEMDPENFATNIEFGRVMKQRLLFPQAVTAFYKALEINPESFFAYLELARTYDAWGDTLKAYDCYVQVAKRDSENLVILREAGEWFYEHGYHVQAEEVLIKIKEKNPDDHSIYDILAKVYQAKGNNDRYQEYQSLADKRSENAYEYPQQTKDHYLKIIEIVHSHGIPFISMQYPLRSVSALKEILEEKKNIIFVENKENFEEALKTTPFSEYFSDNFAGDFGHCTKEGNRLIAKNVADVILKEFFPVAKSPEIKVLFGI